MTPTEYLTKYRAGLIKDLVEEFNELDDFSTFEIMTSWIMGLPAWDYSPFNTSQAPFAEVVKLIGETSTMLYDATEDFQLSRTNQLPGNGILTELAERIFSRIVEVLLPPQAMPQETEACQHTYCKMTIMEQKYEDYLINTTPDGNTEIVDVDDDAEPCPTENISVACQDCPWSEDYTDLASAPALIQKMYHTIYHS